MLQAILRILALAALGLCATSGTLQAQFQNNVTDIPTSAAATQQLWGRLRACDPADDLRQITAPPEDERKAAD